MDPIEILLELVLALVCLGFIALTHYSKTRKGRAKVDAFFESISRSIHGSAGSVPNGSREDVCIACDSRDVTKVADGVYRCNDCEYTGGPGYQAYSLAKQVEALQSKPLAERRKAAASLLSDTTLLMTALEGNIEAAISWSKLDVSKIADAVADMDDVGEAEKRRELYEIQEEILRINGNIEQAGKMLDEDLSDLFFEPDMEFMLSEVRAQRLRSTHRRGYRLEQKIHNEIIAMRDDLQHAKQRIRKKTAEVRSANRRPSPRQLSF